MGFVKINVVEELDLSDLDLLDDDSVHIRCPVCVPDLELQPFKKYATVCNKEAFPALLSKPLGWNEIPPNPCPECLVQWHLRGGHARCPKGHKF